MTNEFAAVAITKYGALSFPEKWQNMTEPKKTAFVRIDVAFTCSVLSKVSRLARKVIILPRLRKVAYMVNGGLQSFVDRPGTEARFLRNKEMVKIVTFLRLSPFSKVLRSKVRLRAP